MARSRGSSRSPSRAAPAPAPAPRAAPAPAPVARAAPPPAPAPAPAPPAPAPAPQMMAPQQQGGGFLSTIAQGFAFGTGSAIARRAVDSVMGGNDNHAPAPAAPAPAPVPERTLSTPAAVPERDLNMGACKWDFQAYTDCMKENKNDVYACEFYHNALKTCQQNNA